MNKNYVILLVVALVVVGLILFNNDKKDLATPESLFKCPEEMPSFEEYGNNRAEVASLLYKENTSLGQEEAMTIIIEMSEKKGCRNDVEYLKEYKKSVNGKEAELNLVSDEYMNSQNLLEYKSNLGFSFKYPDYTKITEVAMGNNWVVVSAKDSDDRKVIISIGDNSENLLAEEWFLGPDSGFDSEQEVFFRTKIDGQDAVYTDSGTWLVVNTPDNKYRLSIAELTTNDTEVMYEEMGVIFKTLKFN